MKKVYSGRRDSSGNAHVWVVVNGESRELPPRLDLWNHSPCGFEWGYAGSGPSQLALAILADATGNDELASRLHQRFKFARIATLRRSQNWTMTCEAVIDFVKDNKP